MNIWTRFLLCLSGALLLLFAPVRLSAQHSFDPSLESFPKAQSVSVLPTDPVLVKLINEEEFFWKDDSKELVLPESQVDPGVLPEVEAYLESFTDEGSGGEWADPSELEETDNPGL